MRTDTRLLVMFAGALLFAVLAGWCSAKLTVCQYAGPSLAAQPAAAPQLPGASDPR